MKNKQIYYSIRLLCAVPFMACTITTIALYVLMLDYISCIFLAIPMTIATLQLSSSYEANVKKTIAQINKSLSDN